MGNKINSKAVLISGSPVLLSEFQAVST